MKRVAIVNQRYGAEVNGGSEYYTKKLAEYLNDVYAVEVLTTNALDYDTWKPYYKTGTEEINGVKVRRFSVEKPRNLKWFKVINKLLVSSLFGSRILELMWLKAQGPYCPQLIEYLQNFKEKYDVFIFVTYLYYTTVAGLPKVSEKAVLVPTAHDEYCIYFSIYKPIFKNLKGIVYLSDEEKKFVEGHFENENITHIVAGAGIDIQERIDIDVFRKKHRINTDYIIYVGRVDTSKQCDVLFDYFSAYKKQYAGELILVVVGKLMMKMPVNKDIVSLGYVSEEDKYSAMAGARALVMPSEHESLSLVVLEAMSLGTPVIVNGLCKVLRAHCEISGGGICYTNQKEFDNSLSTMLYENSNYKKMCDLAQKYVSERYSWKETVEKYKQVIEG